jgi:hypothetical protein
MKIRFTGVKTLTDLVDMGKDAPSRDISLLLRYEKGQLSRTSREFQSLITKGYLDQSGVFTRIGKNALKFYRIRKAKREYTKPSR